MIRSPNQLDKIVLVLLVLLVLPVVEEENDQSQHQQDHHRHVDDLLHSLIIRKQCFELPLLILLVNQQFAVRDDGGPAHLLPHAIIPHSQILNIVVSSAQSPTDEWQLKSPIIPLWFLVQQGYFLVPIQFRDSPLHCDPERIRYFTGTRFVS